MGPATRAACRERLLMLIMSELLELLIPLAYLFCWLLSFYGLNSKVMGNVQSSRWRYVAVDDPAPVVYNVLAFAGADAMSLVINTTALWKVRQVNVLEVFRLVNT